MTKTLLLLVVLVAALTACVRNQPDVIIITATFLPQQDTVADPFATQPPIAQTLGADAVAVNPTPNPTRPGANQATQDYVVQPGDNLTMIAITFGTTVETLMSLNNLTNADQLEVGQILRLPAPPSENTSDFKIIPDVKLVYGPGSGQFDIAAFIAQQPGYIATATDTIDDVVYPAADVIERIAQEYSVDPRLMLVLIEYKAGWLSNANPSDTLKAYPLGVTDSTFGFSRSGLYRQLAYAANQLNAGYYGWKQRGWSTLEMAGGIRMLYAPTLNAATVALQAFFAQISDYAAWQQDISPQGLYSVYGRYFGDPFGDAIDPVVPAGLEQPVLGLPFPRGETWFYTGGPHGGWGAGSAWAAIDFAPPDDLNAKTSSCYVSDYFATALADGVIARISEGAVVLDLDGDGDETTGWTVLYLHIAAQDRVAEGTTVRVGDRIGRPSCEGGVSNGTHMHIARRYNGEWIPASCQDCPPGEERVPFKLDGWTAVGLANQEYQGYLTKDGQSKVAEQFRDVADNRLSW
jgi:LysM repeat protein